MQLCARYTKLLREISVDNKKNKGLSFHGTILIFETIKNLRETSEENI